MTHSDIIVVGAGPAGMAAAAMAARHGATVSLLDEQPRPGGQITAMWTGRSNSASTYWARSISTARP